MISSNSEARVPSSSSLPIQAQTGFTPSPRLTSSGQSSPGFPSQQPNSPHLQAQQRPVQGFISSSEPRRKSSTSTVTTTTTMTHDFAPSTNTRPYSTLPAQRTGNLTFPTPNTSQNLVRSATVKTVDTGETTPGASISGHGDRYSQSEAGHGDHSRHSTNTTATFGKWDKGLRNALRNDDADTLTSVSETSPVSQILRPRDAKLNLYRPLRSPLDLLIVQPPFHLEHLDLRVHPLPDQPTKSMPMPSKKKSAYTTPLDLARLQLKVQQVHRLIRSAWMI